jgi:hypothetical protein
VVAHGNVGLSIRYVDYIIRCPFHNGFPFLFCSLSHRYLFGSYHLLPSFKQ